MRAIAGLTTPAKVANYFVDSATSSTMEHDREKKTSEGGSAASLSLAGAVNVNLLADQAVIGIGKGANIDVDGELTAQANINKKDIVMNGHLKPSGASSTAVGGVVNVLNSRTSSTLDLAGAQNLPVSLTGKNVALMATNDTGHYLLNGGAGSAANKSNQTGNNDTTADTKALQGTVSYVGGESVSKVSLNKDTVVKATGKQTKAEVQKEINAEWKKMTKRKERKKVRSKPKNRV
jgi:hypothetical protein